MIRQQSLGKINNPGFSTPSSKFTMLDGSTIQSENSSSRLHDSLSTVSQKQEQILQGAMQIFLKSGYAGTSMDRVAAEAGVAKQTIYSHFQDKEGLFKALIERVTVRRFGIVFGSEELYGEPEIWLRQVAETYLTKIADREYISLLRLIIAESERFPELAELWTRTVIQRGRYLLSRYFETHPELGIIDPEASAQIFFGSLVSFVMFQELFQGKSIMPMESDRLVNTLVNLILSQAKN